MKKLLSCARSYGLLPMAFSVLAAFPSRAFAIKMMDYDLTSLVYLSRHVLLVERLEKGSLSAASCRVKKVYKGSLLPGSEFPMPELRTYAFKDELTTESWDDDMLFFLDGSLRVVSSGVKLLSKGRVYRFIQGSNPGPYEPFPEGRELTEPDDGDGLPGSPLTLSEFEKELKCATARVVKLETAAKSKDVTTLLDLLGPVRETHPFERIDSRRGVFSDAFTPAVLSEVFARASETDLLEAAARCRYLEFQKLREWPVNDERLLGAAKDQAAPVHRRVAALRVLSVGMMARYKAVEKQVAILLWDSRSEIRCAAARYIEKVIPNSRVHVSPPVDPARTASFVDALWKAWHLERDPLVRTVFLGAFNDELALRESVEKKQEPVLFEGCVRDMTAYYVYVFTDGRDRSADDTAVVAAPILGGAEQRTSLRGSHGVNLDPAVRPDAKELRRVREAAKREAFFGDGRKQLASRIVDFEPPLGPGKYRIWLEGTYFLQGGNKLTVKSTVEEMEIQGDSAERPGGSSLKKG